ncbi:MAG: ABC transporter permease [Lentisphaeria bacterium]|nr:ABC transporter permease [Lentisphaeria bacterium]
MQQEYQTYIEAGRATRLYLKDIWEYRELFWILAKRDILVRYKQTVIGIAWAVIQPLMTLVVFTVVFGKIAGLPSGGVPYILMVLAGTLVWQFFSSTVNSGGNSVISNEKLISKVYFPRIIIPTSAMVVHFVDFLISCGIAVVLFAWKMYLPGWRIIFVPFFLLLCAMLGLGVSYFVASLNVKYRDFRYIVPFVVQAGLYLSPVGFSISSIPGKWQMIYSLNPMVGVIEGMRWCLFGSSLPMFALVSTVIWAIVLLFGGFWMFRRMETEFADFI